MRAMTSTMLLGMRMQPFERASPTRSGMCVPCRAMRGNPPLKVSSASLKNDSIRIQSPSTTLAFCWLWFGSFSTMKPRSAGVGVFGLPTMARV